MSSSSSRGGRGASALAVLVPSLVLACGSSTRAPQSPERRPPIVATATPIVEAPAAAASEAPPEALEPVTALFEPGLLAALQDSGLDIGSRAFGTPASQADVLAKIPAYRDVVRVLRADLAADRTRDPNAGVGMRFSHRQLDADWLVSPRMRFDLVGVVNRLDRKAFAPDTCGEVRFIYRLAYGRKGSGATASRLPFTVNVVHFLAGDPAGSCRAEARRWMSPAPPTAEWARSETGPLSDEALSKQSLKSVEVNAQTVRWPSTVRPNMAGHAEYTLRVFHPAGDGRLEPAPLEDTLDADRLSRDTDAKRELVAWLTEEEHLAAIDEGRVVIPERFLARRAVSVTPHGLSRRANRPFSRVLVEKDFSTVSFQGHRTFSSPGSLIRRLDGLSCPGCHQSRSIAGFHFLGADPASKAADALEMGMSPHFHAEMERRAGYIRAVAAGEAPDEMRPAAEHAPGESGLGAHCGLGEAVYADWTCGDGLRCARLTDDEVGVCVRSEGSGVGDSCERGVMDPRADPHRDFVRLSPAVACGSGVCESNAVGFPGGMCSGGCVSLPDDAVCGRIAVLDPFNRCIAAGQPFERCVADHTRPGALRRCDFHTPCRDDYVCSRTEDGGACMPPYFLFQLRVDGHVP